MESAMFGIDFIRDPYPAYAGLRESMPVVRGTTPNGMDVWLVTRYEDAQVVLTDPRFSKSIEHAGGVIDPHSTEARNLMSMPAAIRNNLLSIDPPDHTRLRRIVARAFTARRVEQLAPSIEKIVDELLDEMAEHDSVDLIPALSVQVPTRVICALLGVPEEDTPRLLRWSLTMVQMSTAPLERFAADSAAFHEYLVALVARKRAEPADDLISSLVQLRDTEGELSDDELISLIAVLIIGGFETTSNLIGNGTLALLQQPQRLAELRDNPELLPAAVDELIRYDCPVHMSTLRFTTEPVTVGDTTIPSGEVVLVSLLSANRDPAQFAHPDELDFGRENRSHLGFGYGIHFCIGGALARLEGVVTFGKLLARFPNLRLAAPVEELPWRLSLLTRGLESLPVNLDKPHEVSTFYDVYSHVLTKIWDDNFHYGYWLSDDDDSSNRVAAQRLTELMIEKVAARPGQRVLDLGCGIGTPAIQLAEVSGAEVVGISINQPQIDEANRRADGRATFQLADAIALPFDDGSFDAAWAFESLLHMDRSKALAELARVVKPGGLVVIADIIQRGPLSEESRAALGPALETFALSPVPTPDDYRGLIAEAGLTLVELQDISENTRKTMPRLIEGTREHYDELVERYGDEGAAYLDVLLSPIASLPEWGYLVAVARA